MSKNQLVLLPESFGKISVGGTLWLESVSSGNNIGPTMARTRDLNYLNVKKVYR